MGMLGLRLWIRFRVEVKNRFRFKVIHRVNVKSMYKVRFEVM